MKKSTKISQIISQIEELLLELKMSLKIQHKTASVPKGRLRRFEHNKYQFSGLTGKIYELIEEGFVDGPKTITDIQKKLKDRGTNKPTTAIMPSLKLLIDKKVLDRNKPDKGLYNYFKR